MRFFLDNCVPDPVGHFLRGKGHEVIFQREAIARDASDRLVALAAAENEVILVTSDKDFKAIASRFMISNRKLKRLSRIQFRCDETKHVARLSVGLSLIEHEWQVAQESSDPRMFVEILDSAFKTLR
jgi:hypothetical protein